MMFKLTLKQMLMMKLYSLMNFLISQMVGFSKAGWHIVCLGHVQIKTVNQLYLILVTG
jgi:hypothetical protein